MKSAGIEGRFDDHARVKLRIAPPPYSLVHDVPTGMVCYAILMRLRVQQSGVLCPQFELATAWDSQIQIESFDYDRRYVDFGDQYYPMTNVLNLRIAKGKALPCNRTVEGYLLASGTRAIPDQLGDWSAADCVVAARDPISGGDIETVITQIMVMRSRKLTSK